MGDAPLGVSLDAETVDAARIHTEEAIAIDDRRDGPAGATSDVGVRGSQPAPTQTGDSGAPMAAPTANSPLRRRETKPVNPATKSATSSLRSQMLRSMLSWSLPEPHCPRRSIVAVQIGSRCQSRRPSRRSLHRSHATSGHRFSAACGTSIASSEAPRRGVAMRHVPGPSTCVGPFGERSPPAVSRSMSATSDTARTPLGWSCSSTSASRCGAPRASCCTYSTVCGRRSARCAPSGSSTRSFP